MARQKMFQGSIRTTLVEDNNNNIHKDIRERPKTQAKTPKQQRSSQGPLLGNGWILP